MERYNSITSETSLSEVLANEHPVQQQGQATNPKSPSALSIKTNLAQAHPSHISLASKGKGSQVDLNSPYLGPQAKGDVHLSADQPRYFPGVVTRGQRKNSKRQDSVHEGVVVKGRVGGGDQVVKEE